MIKYSCFLFPCIISNCVIDKDKFFILIYSRYGGVYLDSDIIVLKPLYSLKNSVGIENQINGSSIFNGAVMAFDKYR